MKQHISKLTNLVVSVSKKYPLRIFLSGIIIGSIVGLCWFYSARAIPTVQAGEGEAINPELKES